MKPLRTTEVLARENRTTSSGKIGEKGKSPPRQQDQRKEKKERTPTPKKRT